MRLVILPGMDGGSALLAPFVAALPSWLEPMPVEYPPSAPLGYDALETSVRSVLTSSREPVALLGESFSGPIAIRIAAAPPPHLRALVLVSTFVEAPLPRWLRIAVGAPLFARPPPRALVRRTLLAPDSSDALVDAALAALARTTPAVMAKRARAVLSVDVRAELARVRLPILALEPTRDRLLRRSLRRARRDLCIVTLDTPHLLLQSAPEQSAAHVARFLASHAR